MSNLHLHVISFTAYLFNNAILQHFLRMANEADYYKISGPECWVNTVFMKVGFSITGGPHLTCSVELASQEFAGPLALGQ